MLSNGSENERKLVYIRECPACKQMIAMRMTPQQMWDWDARWKGRATALTNWLVTFTPLLGWDMINPRHVLEDGMVLTEEEWDMRDVIDPDEDDPDIEEE